MAGKLSRFAPENWEGVGGWDGEAGTTLPAGSRVHADMVGGI